MIFIILQLQLLDSLLDWFNSFCSFFFVAMKLLLGFLLISIGVLTTMRLRGAYFLGRLRSNDKDNSDNNLTRIGAFIGSLYIVFGAGIILNYAIYLFIFLFDALPEPYLFSLIDMITKELSLTESINISVDGLPHERAIYYCFSFASFSSFLMLSVSIYSLCIRMQNIARNIKLLVTSLITEIFVGFTIFMPLML